MPSWINNNAHLENAIGASGWTAGDATFTGQKYLLVDRASAFQSYCGAGPTGTFGADGSNYYILFDGNGGVAHRLALGIDGNDTYHASQLPIVGRWIRFAMRYTLSGVALKGYYDIGVTDSTWSVTTSPSAVGWEAGSVMFWGAAPWDEAGGSEWFRGGLRYLKAFTDDLSDSDVATESAVWYPATSAGQSAIWGCWPLFNCTKERDITGNGRHLVSTDGQVNWSVDDKEYRNDYGQWPKPPWRNYVGVAA